MIGDFPLMLPVVSVTAIGAGGGSVLWVDPQGVLKVGPTSAGADPGPVCYGIGGTQPTITDCYLVAGYLNPDNFLGGRMYLDIEGARCALAELGKRTGFSGVSIAEETAEAALHVATAKMATELFKILAQNGLDPELLTLMPFGGAGPVHANMLAAEVGLSAIIVPPAAGTFCALGALIADVKRDFVRSLRVPVGRSTVTDSEIWRGYERLEEEALTWIAGEGEILGRTTLQHTADMRYAGQAFDLNIKVPEDLLAARDALGLIDLFHQAHERLYGFRDTESPVELTTVRVRATGEVPPIELPRLSAGAAARPFGARQVRYNGQRIAVPLYTRTDLPSGQEIEGPAIIEQEDSTVCLLAGWRLTVGHYSELLITEDKK
jgi:N-methylhydantoinase A